MGQFLMPFANLSGVFADGISGLLLSSTVFFLRSGQVTSLRLSVQESYVKAALGAAYARTWRRQVLRELRIIEAEPIPHIFTKTLRQGEHLLGLLVRDHARPLVFSQVSLLSEFVQPDNQGRIGLERVRKRLKDPIMMTFP